MSNNLVIVESPAKAKTIEKFLGSDYTVKSSFGHIRDLPKSGMGVDIEHDFEPTYEVSADKTKVVNELKKAAKGVDTVWLASDEDREGEAIAWHLSAALNLKPKETKRIVFHEITKPAITEAIKNPRTVDENLVNAQQARRVLDRLVGYELSPVLWRKVRAGLSAGRVQSVAVRLIVDREREIEAFSTASMFRVTAEFDAGGKNVLRASLPEKFKTEKEADAFLKKLIGADFAVEALETTPAEKSPTPPFTTSTLQQEASRKLGFPVKRTMMVAQKLYEAGKITYMRTDSVNLSNIALAQAAKMIEKEYGKNYVQVRKFKTKSASAQEAHEAIRPTDLAKSSVGGDPSEQKLYELIWKRTVASQMSNAKLERTTATITVSSCEDKFVAKGEVIVFDGFLTLYLEGRDDAEDEENGKILPPLKEGQVLKLLQAEAQEKYTTPPPRYTEATLVRTLEEKGIGRPSTYAPTISTVQDRGYVEKANIDGKERDLHILTLKTETITPSTRTEVYGADRSHLMPTELGEIVTDFLVKHFGDVVDYTFTAKVEDEFDKIAEGKETWNKMIGGFYKGFHKTVEDSADISREEAQQSRELGIDPKTGKPISVRMGRFGPMVQLGTKDDEEKPKFASIPKGQKMEEVTFEQALELLTLPRIIGQDKEGIDIKANFGRFGPYIQREKLYVSISEDELFSITLDEALKRIEEKKKAEAEKYIQVWEEEDIQVLNGRFGPYIKAGKKNVKIPKDKEPAKLTLEECKELIAKAPEKKGRFPRRKKS